MENDEFLPENRLIKSQRDFQNVCVHVCHHRKNFGSTNKYNGSVRDYTRKLMRENCPNIEIFLVRIFLYSVRIQENTDHKKLHIWTLFTQ